MGPKLVVFFHGIEAEGSNGGEETYEQIDEEDDGKSYVSLGGWIRRKRWAGKRFVALDNDPQMPPHALDRRDVRFGNRGEIISEVMIIFYGSFQVRYVDIVVGLVGNFWKYIRS